MFPLIAAAALLSACVAPKGKEKAPAPPETGFTPIRSELVFSANYYDADETLAVVLRSGDVLDYRKAPRALFEQWLAAEDKDTFYRDHLQGRFDEKKVEF
jgi:hypothetical protein